MNRKLTSGLVQAAVAGLFAGGTMTLIGCNNAAQTQTDSSNDSAATDGDMGMRAAWEMDLPKHACKGLNECAGQGGCAVEGANACASQNECSGRGGCATIEHHGCAGQNECAGLGGCAVEGDHECATQNECAGQGGCSIPVAPR